MQESSNWQNWRKWDNVFKSLAPAPPFIKQISTETLSTIFCQ
jgi:hypothetical protein